MKRKIINEIREWTSWGMFIIGTDWNKVREIIELLFK
jgi:hypothetical protein